MQDNNTYVTKEFKDDFEFSEIDFELQNEFGFEWDDDKDFVIIPKNGWGGADGYPINIDRLIEKLNEFKTNGATHVELNYHCDHIGYQISSYKMELSEQFDIDEYKSILQKEKNKNDRIQELQDEIRKVKNS